MGSGKDDHSWDGDDPLEVQFIESENLHYNVVKDSNSTENQTNKNNITQ